MRILAFLFACIVVSESGVPLARADGFPAGAGLRSAYVRLRNLDPSGDHPVYASRWVSLAGQMHELTSRLQRGVPARDLLFAADTHYRVYRHTKQPDFLNRAEALTERALSVVGSSGDDSGEALILQGDIHVAQGKGGQGALQWYQRALHEQASTARIARSRIMSLQNGTFASRIPSSDIDTPRVIARSAAPRRVIKKRIVIDPGHGGFDAGAIGYGGQREKDLTLDLAKRVKELLGRVPSVAVLLTREDDTFVPLARRTSYANKRRADAFISLHLNASPSHKLRGLEAYYLDTTDDDASRLLAERENGIVQGGEVDDLSFILSDLIQSGKLEGSVELTHHIERSVGDMVTRFHERSTSHGVKKGPFFVLVGAHMPCSLIELFFIDNPLDGAKLATEGFRTIIANGLVDGLIRFALPGEALQVRSRPQRATQPRNKVGTRAGGKRKKRA